MQPEQQSMTVIASVARGREDELKSLLRVIGGDIGADKANTYLRFADFPTIHFARWVVIPPLDPANLDPDNLDPANLDPDNLDGFPYVLAFGTDHDGPDEALIEALAASPMALNALDAVYSHCEGWPGMGDLNQVMAYFLTRRIPYGGRHIACRRRTVEQLKDAVAARGRMESVADTVIHPAVAREGQELSDPEARQRLSAIRQGAGSLPPIPAPPPNWQLPAVAAGAAAVLAGGLSLLFRRSPAAGWLGVAALIGLPAAYLGALRRHETADAAEWVEATPPTLDHLHQLRVWEDHKVQNQMTHIVAVKPGLFRRWTLRGVLAGVNLLARFYWNRRQLGDIPTIHFARWMLLDNGARLLFFSNFDGSWENYLGDFIDRASHGLTGVWSNTVEFPPTTGLVFDGSRRAEAFKNWTRKHQIETQAWYSAYPDVSVVNLLDALALCRETTQGRERDLLGTL